MSPVNPYETSSATAEVAKRRSSFLPIAKTAICVFGLALFATNPWRDLWFYEDIAAHEGFDTIADAYIIGVAGQLLATIFLFPVAALLIIFGIARSTRFSIRPRFDRFTWRWGIMSSAIALLMLVVEANYIIYGIRHAHHLDTVSISLSYAAFIYVWWCCSLSHGSIQRKPQEGTIRS